MRKIRNLIGLPVICCRRRIGRLVRADLSGDLKRLEGIWVDAGLKGTRYIPCDQLSTIGEHAVIADGRGQRRKCTGKNLFYRAISTDGARIGAIVGAEIDEISFLVQSLELTRGLWDDLLPGRSRIVDYCMHGSDVIVRDSAQDFGREDEL